MVDLPRKAVTRTARLAALPLGYAGRTAWGMGKRLGGKPAEVVLSEVQQRTAEQLFRTLGELKGGAMKFGQALSVLEAALPESASAPYREQLTALQDNAPTMSTQQVRDVIAESLGPDWRKQITWLDGAAAAAASIGQVHRGTWQDGREVAIKVQFPGADEALLGDLRQLARVARGISPVFPGLDIPALVAELQDRAAEELDYTLEGEAQQVFAEAFAGDPEILVPQVVFASERVLVSEWLESEGSLARVIAEGTEEERDHYGEQLVKFTFAGPARTGMLHADPHPGNFRTIPDEDGTPGRLGVLDFGAVARLPGGAFPEAMGRLLRDASEQRADVLLAGLREEGFVRPGVRVDAEALLEYLSPFVEPMTAERFRFSRAWMREQYERLNDPRSPHFTMATKINLPPEYLLIHRTWLGGVGLLCQLEAEVPFRALLEESLPGFAE